MLFRLGGTLGALCLSLSLIAASPALAEPAVWRVTDDDTEMLLFGSVHSLPPHIEWRSDVLDAALAAADLVAFEILTPETEEEASALYAPLSAYLFAQRPLREVVSAETWTRLDAFLAVRGLSADGLNGLRPWAAALVLEVIASEGEGSSDQFGVDNVLEQSLAPGQRKEALDTAPLLLATIQSLADYGDAEAELMLGQTLDWYEDLEGQPDWAIEEAWAAGDVDSVAALTQEMKTEAPLLYQTIMVDRNVAWMTALGRMMETEARVVVIVGAAHLAGPDGLPALLRQAGYAVEGP